MIAAGKKARVRPGRAGLGVSVRERLHLGPQAFWRRAIFKLMVGYVAPHRPRRFPLKLQIEATSTCNLRCPSCSHAKETGKGEHLSEDALCKILDALPWLPERVVLSGIGEPLLNPRFFPLVDILARRGINCEFYTNGTLLNAANREAILSRSNIVTVNVSCDGSRKDTFERLRVGADFDRWKQSVHEFIAEAGRQRGATLTIGMNVVLSKENLAEFGDILRLTAALGIGHVYVMDPIPVDEVAAALCPSAAEASAVRQEADKLSAELGIAVTCFFRRTATPPDVLPGCMQPWEYMMVRANGDVAPCCAVFGSEKSAVLGNLLEQDFNSIWRGQPYRDFRRTNVAGTNALCRICPYY